MSQESIIQFKCEGGHTWEGKDTGMCPECYTTNYFPKRIMDVIDSDKIGEIYKLIDSLASEHKVSHREVIEIIEEMMC